MRYNELLDKPTSTVEELAHKHGVPVSYIRAQLRRGIAVEHEHTKKTNLATEIALDHLGEDPDYYKKLSKIEEAFDQPYKAKWEKSEADDSVDALVRLPDGSNLSIMFNMDYDEEGEEVIQVEFWRNNSQEVTGEGDAQRIFATVLDAIQKYIKKYKPQRLSFSASKEVEADQNSESRAKLYDRLVQRYARVWGYRAFRAETGTLVRYELSRLARGMAENFLDEALRVDVPNEEWLQNAIDYAKQKSPDRNGLPYMGKTTATVRSVDVPVNILKRIPGMRREQQNVRQADLAAIVKIMSDTGKLPLHGHTGEEYKPFINVAYDGSAWVNEGNHRIMAAAKLGWETLPVEISYFDGGERVKDGAMYPGRIGLGHTPLDEDWKKAVATGALAAATALGTPAMGAGLPDLVAVVIMNINGNIVRKEINLGNEYAGPTEAAEAIDKFMTSKGIKNYSLEIQRVPAKKVDENFADGKNPGRKGLSKRMGVNTKASVSSLRNTAKHSSGEKQRMAHWLANMKAGRAKAKRK